MNQHLFGTAVVVFSCLLWHRLLTGIRKHTQMMAFTLFFHPAGALHCHKPAGCRLFIISGTCYSDKLVKKQGKMCSRVYLISKKSLFGSFATSVRYHNPTEVPGRSATCFSEDASGKFPGNHPGKRTLNLEVRNVAACRSVCAPAVCCVSVCEQRLILY